MNKSLINSKIFLKKSLKYSLYNERNAIIALIILSLPKVDSIIYK